MFCGWGFLLPFLRDGHLIRFSTQTRWCFTTTRDGNTFTLAHEKSAVVGGGEKFVYENTRKRVSNLC